MARRVWFKERVFSEFVNTCRSDSADDVKIRPQLEALGEDPSRGLAIPPTSPLFYQLPIPPTAYVAHYIFDEQNVEILYLGIPGKC
jgi:hypothetical protein